MEATLYTLVTWFIGFCYGFVLLSSAAGQNGDFNLFQKGDSLRYNWRSTVFLNEKDGGDKSVGFAVTGKVVISVIWGEGDKKLLKVEVSLLLIKKYQKTTFVLCRFI